MRRFRLLLLIFFLVVFAVFMASTIHEYMTSDSVAPVISTEEDVMHLSVDQDKDELLLHGMTALDNLDGDVSDSLVVVSKSKFIAKATRNVSYAAFDVNNNVGTYTRKLVYTDYHSPRFVINEPMRFAAGNSSYDYLRYVRAIDCLDGNISTQIKITFGETEATSDTVSTQKVNIQVTNSAGDTSTLSLTATFEDFDTYSKASPALTDYVIYVQPGERPNLRSYLGGIWMAGNTRQYSDLSFNPDRDITIDDSKVNYSTPGAYIATYRLSRATPNAMGEDYRVDFGTAQLIIVVEDPS